MYYASNSGPSARFKKYEPILYNLLYLNKQDSDAASYLKRNWNAVVSATEYLIQTHDEKKILLVKNHLLKIQETLQDLPLMDDLLVLAYGEDQRSFSLTQSFNRTICDLALNVANIRIDEDLKDSEGFEFCANDSVLLNSVSSLNIVVNRLRNIPSLVNGLNKNFTMLIKTEYDRLLLVQRWQESCVLRYSPMSSAYHHFFFEKSSLSDPKFLNYLNFDLREPEKEIIPNWICEIPFASIIIETRSYLLPVCEDHSKLRSSLKMLSVFALYNSNIMSPNFAFIPVINVHSYKMSTSDSFPLEISSAIAYGMAQFSNQSQCDNAIECTILF